MNYKANIKTIFAFLFIVSQLMTYGQEEHSFKIQKNQLEWEKVFESEMSITEVEEILKALPVFKNITSEGGSLSGEIENVTPDYQSSGKSSGGTSSYLQNSSIIAAFYIEFEDGRYRTTLNRIYLSSSDDLSGSGLSIVSANYLQPLSDFAVKKGDFRSRFLRADAQTFEITFSRLFDFDNYAPKSDDW